MRDDGKYFRIENNIEGYSSHQLPSARIEGPEILFATDKLWFNKQVGNHAKVGSIKAEGPVLSPYVN